MRRNLIILLLLSAVLSVITCRKEEDKPVKEDTYDVYTNPSDPALLTVSSSEEAFITYYGERDPYYFNKLSVLFPDEHDEYVMFLDLYQRPVQIYSADGATYLLLWHDNSRFLLSAISPSGEIQVSVPIHLDSLNIEKETGQGGKPARSRKALVSSTSIGNPAFRGTNDGLLPGTHEVSLSKCNAPISTALVILNTYPVIGRNLYLGGTTGEGVFFVKSPGSQAAIADDERLCREVTSGLFQQLQNPFWEKLYNELAPDAEILADILSDEIIAAFPKEPASKVLLRSCSKAVNILTLVSKMAFENDKETVCARSNAVYIGSEGLNYTSTITVKEPGEQAYTTESYPFNPNSSSSWQIEVPGSATARARFTQPDDPVPAQDYIAKAFIICPQEGGTEITLKIEGTDGYFNEDSITIYENTEVSLDVPGGGEGVRDVITIGILEKEWKLSIIF